MSKFVFITGDEQNQENFYYGLSKAINAIKSSDEFGDDDLDPNTYIVFPSNTKMMTTIEKYSKDTSTPTIGLYPEYDMSPQMIFKPDFIRKYRDSNRFQVVFDNTDIVVCIGEPTDYCRAAKDYGCKVLYYK